MNSGSCSQMSSSLKLPVDSVRIISLNILEELQFRSGPFQISFRILHVPKYVQLDTAFDSNLEFNSLNSVEFNSVRCHYSQYI